jgi:hypothetical protein
MCCTQILICNLLLTNYKTTTKLVHRIAQISNTNTQLTLKREKDKNIRIRIFSSNEFNKLLKSKPSHLELQQIVIKINICFGSLLLPIVIVALVGVVFDLFVSFRVNKQIHNTNLVQFSKSHTVFITLFNVLSVCSLFTIQS